MQSGTARAKKYRERGMQIRDIAEDVRGADNRKYLLDVAADFEQLAAEIERKTKS